MRIAQVAPLQVAVPPRTYGGTERCVANVTEALVRLGHDVTLFATGDSRTSACLVPMLPEALNFSPDAEITAHHLAMLAEVYRRADDFDVIHSHLDYLTLPFVQTTQTPTVITLHGRLDRPDYKRIFQTYQQANYVSISESQRSDIPDLNWVATVHHSLDVEDFTYYPDSGEYLAFVGRMSPEKRPDRAIEIAIRAGIPLKIAAKIDPSERPYFESVIAPMLDHPLIEWLGALDEQAKRELMGNAMALLMPIDWPEPFGIVFIEALACGTPVITCPLGSVPELLVDGLTGYIRSTVDELVEAVRLIPAISRAECRAYARRRFDIQRMAVEYLNVYSRVRRSRKLFAVTAEGHVAARSATTNAVHSTNVAKARDAVKGVAAVRANGTTPRKIPVLSEVGEILDELAGQTDERVAL